MKSSLAKVESRREIEMRSGGAIGKWMGIERERTPIDHREVSIWWKFSRDNSVIDKSIQWR